MNSDQTTGSLTLSDKSKTKTGEENQSESGYDGVIRSDQRKKELQDLVLSLSHKVDELTQINERLSQISDPPEERKLVSDNPGLDISLPDSSAPDALVEPVLVYRLSFLMDFLSQTMGFHNWGVFLLSNNNSEIQKIVSSSQFMEDEFLNDFADEVEAQWKSGDISQAVTQRRRIILPAEAGELLIVPFNILGKKDGLWVAQFPKGVPAETNSFANLLFWVDQVATSIENSYLNKSSLSVPEEKSYQVESEKLFTVVQLSRAMVHGMNNYLQIILGRIQIVRMNQNKSPESVSNTRIWETIEGNANRICSILKSFSDFLHRQSGELADTREVNLQHILEGNLVLLQYILKSNGIELELKIEDDLPALYGDPGELELAFMSLFWGIRDCLNSGGNICFQASKEKESLCLSAYCTEKTSEKDKCTSLAEFQKNDRFNLVAQILSKHNGVLKFEEATGGEKKFVLRFPIGENKTEDIWMNA